MDYGQSNRNGNKQPFFTAEPGLGKEQASNPYEEGANLSNDSAPWKEEVSNATGDKIIGPNEHNVDIEQAKDEPNTPELGEIVNIEQPPNMGISPKDESKIIESSFDRNAIKITGGSFDATVIKEIEKVADKKLEKEDDAAGYYESIRGKGGMTNANLENSFGNDAVWKEKAA